MRAMATKYTGRSNGGLTLVEMVVVMAMCAVVAAMIVPMLFRTRAIARTAMCAENLHAVGQAYSLLVQDSAGVLPDSYYVFNGQGGIYQVALRTPQSGLADALFSAEARRSLECPADDTPVEVGGRSMSGRAAVLRSSYAYNVALPLLYCNASRMKTPAELVTYYDGDLSVIAGSTWEYDQAWALNTIRYRHRGNANFLFADGHVETIGRYPGITFVGGLEWLNNPRNTAAIGPEPVAPTQLPHGVSGVVTININPNASAEDEFTLTLPDGTTVTRTDLANDTVFALQGFSPNYLDYTGPAVVVNVKPKGNSGQNGLTLDGMPYPLANGSRYVISSQTMKVHLYNDQRDANGKAMGKWWIEITATNAHVQTI